MNKPTTSTKISIDMETKKIDNYKVSSLLDLCINLRLHVYLEYSPFQLNPNT